MDQAHEEGHLDRPAFRRGRMSRGDRPGPNKKGGRTMAAKKRATVRCAAEEARAVALTARAEALLADAEEARAEVAADETARE